MTSQSVSSVWLGVKRKILLHLQQRTTDNKDKSKPHHRKDMIGITTDLDSNATMANFTYKPKKKDKRDDLLFFYSSDPALHHILQSIIAGSIRAPDRL